MELLDQRVYICLSVNNMLTDNVVLTYVATSIKSTLHIVRLLCEPPCEVIALYLHEDWLTALKESIWLYA